MSKTLRNVYAVRRHPATKRHDRPHVRHIVRPGSLVLTLCGQSVLTVCNVPPDLPDCRMCRAVAESKSFIDHVAQAAERGRSQ